MSKAQLLRSASGILAAKTIDALDEVPYDRLTFDVIDGEVAGRIVVQHDVAPAVEQALFAFFGLVEVCDSGFTFVIAEHHKPHGWNQHPEMPTTFDIAIDCEDHQ